MRQTTLTQSKAPGRVIGTRAFNTWIASKFSMFHSICLLLILVGVELPLCIFVIAVTLS